MIVYVCMLGAWRGYCNGVPDCTSTPKVEYYPPPEAPKSRINIYIYIFFYQRNKTQVVSSGCCHLKGLVEIFFVSEHHKFWPSSQLARYDVMMKLDMTKCQIPRF